MSLRNDQRRAANERRRLFEQRLDDECRRSGHSRPTNRREFLAPGLIGGVSTVFLPSIATILAREAQAQTGCVIDTSPTLGAGKIQPRLDQSEARHRRPEIWSAASGQETFLDPAGYAPAGLPRRYCRNIGVDRRSASRNRGARCRAGC